MIIKQTIQDMFQSYMECMTVPYFEEPEIRKNVALEMEAIASAKEETIRQFFKDGYTVLFLSEFMDGLEKRSKTKGAIDKLKVIDNDGKTLFVIDREDMEW